jgi:hypothetical protein
MNKNILFVTLFVFTAMAYAQSPMSNISVNWIEATEKADFPLRVDSASLVYDNKMWIIGGNHSSGSFLNDVWFSTDGVKWNSVVSKSIFSPRTNPPALVFKNKMWIIGGWALMGPLNDVWFSLDGSKWKKVHLIAPFSPGDYKALVYDNKMWLLGGKKISLNQANAETEVWSSTDGLRWVKVLAKTPFFMNEEHAALVYDNKMWVVGKGDDINYKVSTNDSWYSTDGVKWTKVSSSEPFPADFRFTALVYNGAMWVIAGDMTNDAWFSSDGMKWEKASTSSSFPVRFGQISLVYKNQMWVIGGETKLSFSKWQEGWTKTINDVWHSL